MKIPPVVHSVNPTRSLGVKLPIMELKKEEPEEEESEEVENDTFLDEEEEEEFEN